MVKSFNEFYQELKKCGFTLNEKSKGIYSIVPDWTEQDDSPVMWHTGDAETDPWEWRMRVLEEEYYNGNISAMEKKVYDIIAENGAIPLDVMKKLAEITKENKSKFDRAITHLQMKMYITMCGKSKKVSRSGNEFGWNSTVFCTVEKFWGEEFVQESFKIPTDEAELKIREQIYSLNPNAEEKNIRKFIGV